MLCYFLRRPRNGVSVRFGLLSPLYMRQLTDKHHIDHILRKQIAFSSRECIYVIMHVVVGLIPLNGRCQTTDRCADPAASCYSGFCLCRTTHYQLNNTCRTFYLLIKLVVEVIFSLYERGVSWAGNTMLPLWEMIATGFTLTDIYSTVCLRLLTYLLKGA